METHNPQSKIVAIEVVCDVFGPEETHPAWCACRGLGVFTVTISVPARAEQEDKEEDRPN